MRYFISTLHQISELEQKIKRKETDSVFQVVVRENNHIRRFTWTMLTLDINFERKPLGSGITIFYVDTSVSFFVADRKK